jgi:flagellar protein FliO/FliZ
MLLVKSKESKNSGKLQAQKALGLLLCTPFAAFAQSSTGFSANSIVSIFLSLLAIVALIFGLAYFMRRFNVTQTGSSQIENVASMMVGTKERIMVIQVGDEQHLLGITATNINHLSKLEIPLESKSKEMPGEVFKQKFTQLLNANNQPKDDEK